MSPPFQHCLLGSFMQNSANAATQIPMWVPIIVSLIGGGAAGAIITAVVTKYRNRRQPVGYRMEIIEIFKRNRDFPSLQTILRVGDEPSESTPGFVVNNLSVARITLINKGNQDIEQFNFGITLEGSNKAVDLKWETLDRHHVTILHTPVGLDKPATELDLTLQPFNRNEEYNFNLYFTYKDESGLIRLSSSHSTQFALYPNRPSEVDYLKHMNDLYVKTLIVAAALAYALYKLMGSWLH